MFRTTSGLTLTTLLLEFPIMPKSCLIRVVAAALLAMLSSSSLYAQEINIQSGDGRLSIRANNASVIDLATQLSEQLGITVVVTGDSETPLTIDIADEPVEKAINQLSPNNMVVRAGEFGKGDITEIVLIMGESSDGSSGGSDEFLPSGSPADEVLDDGSDPNLQASEGSELRDPNRAQAARDAAAAAANDAGLSGDASGVNPGEVVLDPVSGLPVDPATGLPLDP